MYTHVTCICVMSVHFERPVAMGFDPFTKQFTSSMAHAVRKRERYWTKKRIVITSNHFWNHFKSFLVCFSHLPHEKIRGFESASLKPPWISQKMFQQGKPARSLEVRVASMIWVAIGLLKCLSFIGIYCYRLLNHVTLPLSCHRIANQCSSQWICSLVTLGNLPWL